MIFLFYIYSVKSLQNHNIFCFDSPSISKHGAHVTQAKRITIEMHIKERLKNFIKLTLFLLN